MAGRGVLATARVETPPLMQVEMDAEPLSFWNSMLQYRLQDACDVNQQRGV